MTAFPLRIVTPDGMEFEGQVQELIVRTVTGDMGILAGHINCVAPLGMGTATIVVDGQKRYAACIGGMVSVADGAVTLVPTTFEWSDEIDLGRVEASQQRAKAILASNTATDTELRLAEARLKRALVRRSAASYK